MAFLKSHLPKRKQRLPDRVRGRPAPQERRNFRYTRKTLLEPDRIMALTLGFTGMDSATEAALTAAFQQANASLGNTWQLLPDADAATVIVDMDSMYGPMSWLRLHAAGKQVVGLSSARAHADRLPPRRPVDAAGRPNAQAVSSGKPRIRPQPPAPGGWPAPSAARRRAGAAPRRRAPLRYLRPPSPVPRTCCRRNTRSPVDEESDAVTRARSSRSVSAGTLAPTTIAGPRLLRPHLSSQLPSRRAIRSLRTGLRRAR